MAAMCSKLDFLFDKSFTIWMMMTMMIKIMEWSVLPFRNWLVYVHCICIYNIRLSSPFDSSRSLFIRISRKPFLNYTKYEEKPADKSNCIEIGFSLVISRKARTNNAYSMALLAFSFFLSFMVLFYSIHDYYYYPSVLNMVPDLSIYVHSQCTCIDWPSIDDNKTHAHTAY